MELVSSQFVAEILRLYPEELREAVARGLKDLTLDAMGLGWEVLRSEQKGYSLAEAAARQGEFPLIARAHYGVIDLLQIEISPQDEELLLAVVRHATTSNPRGFSHLIVRIASARDLRWEPAMCRFMIYELIRVATRLLTSRDGPKLEGAGIFADLDNTLDALTRDWCGLAAMQDPELQPLDVLLAGAMESLESAWLGFNSTLKSASREYMAELHQLIDAARVAQSVEAGEAAIVRNAIAARRGDEPLQLQPLIDRHPLALTSHDAAKKKASRLRQRLAEGDGNFREHGETLEPRKRRVVDLLLDVLAEEEAA